MSGKTLAKLNLRHLDDTLQFSSVCQMMSNLYTSAISHFNTIEDVMKERQLLKASMMAILRAAYPPKKEIQAQAMVEMEHQQGTGLPLI